jgi:hypothetical protein
MLARRLEARRLALPHLMNVEAVVTWPQSIDLRHDSDAIDGFRQRGDAYQLSLAIVQFGFRHWYRVLPEGYRCARQPDRRYEEGCLRAHARFPLSLCHSP